MIVMTAKSSRLNLKEEARIMLTMVQETGEKYGSSYLLQLLKGDQRYAPKAEAHLSVTGYGTFPEAHPDRLRNILRFLQRRELLRVQDERYGVWALTEAGIAFLQAPHDLWVDYRSLRRKPYEQKLLNELRRLRRELSQSRGVAPFEVFTDYQLESLVALLPTDVATLTRMGSFDDEKVNLYGPALLKLTQAAQAAKTQAAQAQLEKQTKSPAHQATKSLFEAGLSETEIAARREVKPATVRQQLLRLHRAGEINLTPWIEQTVAPEDLAKGGEFFQKQDNPRLKAAFEALGLDYATLRLCRLYVSDLSSRQEHLAAG